MLFRNHGQALALGRQAVAQPTALAAAAAADAAQMQWRVPLTCPLLMFCTA